MSKIKKLTGINKFIDPVATTIATGDIKNLDPFDITGSHAKAKSKEEQKKQNQRETAEKQQLAFDAKESLFQLFPAAQTSRELGFQRALDIQGAVIPQQLGAIQQGNVGAQEALLAGLPQIRNAILGRPVHMSQLQPQTIDIDTSFAQQQLPQFSSPLLGQAAIDAQEDIDRLAAEEAAVLADQEALAAEERQREAAAIKQESSAAGLINLQKILGGLRI